MDRVGEVNINNQGLKMTIVEYINSKDISVQFEDGIIVKHKRYELFKDGKIKHPNSKQYNFNNRVGEENINNKGFKMIIINYINNNHIDIQFEDGTIVYNKKYCHFKDGKIKHPLYDNNGCLIINNTEKSMDSISIPEKFMLSILKQLDIDYIYQLNHKKFQWCNNFRYDFYLPEYNTIIETHGGQHYDKNKGWDDDLYTIQMNDLFKYKCAKNHIDNYIVIDCRYSKFNWLKENTIKELEVYFDLTKINWELAWEESQNSLCVKTWELWNNGLCVGDIVDELKIGRTAVVRYLKIGKELDKCNYDVEESRRRGRCKIKGRNNWKTMPVMCLNTKRIFVTIDEGAKFYNIKSKTNITKCCKGERKYCGKLEDGTELVWRYVKWNHNKRYKLLNDTMDNM